MKCAEITPAGVSAAAVAPPPRALPRAGVAAGERPKPGEPTAGAAASQAEPVDGGARGFAGGMVEGVGGFAVSVGSTVGYTTKDLGERTVAITQRLWAAAAGVYGAAAVAEQYGVPVPIPAGRLREAVDGEAVELAGRRLTPLFAEVGT